MGSRAVALVCRDAEAARERFGVDGRPDRLAVHPHRPPVLRRRGGHRGDPRPAPRRPSTAAGPVGGAGHGLAAAGRRADAVVAEGVRAAALAVRGGRARPPARSSRVRSAALEAAAARGVDVDGPAGAASANGPRTPPRSPTPTAATAGPTDGLDGVRLAPFQILAVQGRSLAGLPHDEQLALLDRLVEHDGTGLLQTTRRLYVDTGDAESVRAGVDWWLEMTGRGGEGMVVKPLGALVRGGEGPAGPARHQVPRPRVPADHLRPGVHPPGEPRRGCAAAS